MVTQIYPELDVELFELKGVFCYDYVDLFARLNKLSLPQRAACFNNLGGAKCSKLDYGHVQPVFANFQFESLKDYIKP